MAVEHNVITDAERHEPKGADAATVGQYLIADGANAAAWAARRVYLTATIEDISVAKSQWLTCPCAGNIEKIYSVLEKAIITADEVITHEIVGSLVTTGTITVTQAGSAAGDADSTVPSAANVLTAGQAIEIINSGASGTVAKLNLTYVILRTDNAAN